MEIISLAVIFLLITIIGTLGNAIVLFVICVNKQLHDRTNILIGNLALADLLFLIYCAPVTAYSYVFSWGLSESLCYIAVTLQYVTCYVSVWTLVFLAYDRYLSITSSTVTRIRQGNAVIYACVVIWVAMFGINFLHMRNVGVLRFQYGNDTRAACVDSLTIATEEASIGEARVYYWSFNLLAFLLPLSLSIVFYFLLVKELWKERMVKSKSSKRMKRHATRMVFIVIITFAICWMPQNIRFFLRGLNYPELSFWEMNTELLFLIQSTAQILAYLNSLLNPILYGLLSERPQMEASSNSHSEFITSSALSQSRHTEQTTVCAEDMNDDSEHMPCAKLIRVEQMVIHSSFDEENQPNSF
uniref:G-protein coupled receptors family 1 profile domain-containing protein n=1 Tax=Acrobeloides nanus TaxID=290746 RepID=A0A914DYD9_9BILA